MTEKYTNNSDFKLVDLLDAELTGSDFYDDALELVILHGQKLDVTHQDLILKSHPYMDSFYIKSDEMQRFKDTLQHIVDEISHYMDKEQKK